MQWRLSCLTDWSQILLQMVTATRFSTTGSSAVLTKNTLIRRVISIASSSYSWTHCSKVGQYRTAPTFSSITMLRSRVAGLKVYPKRLGQVFQTRYYAATGNAGPSLTPGSKFAGALTASGQRLAEALVTLK